MNETKKWMLHRVSAIILTPLYIWFYFSLVSLSSKNYFDAINFFKNPLFETLIIVLFFVGFFHAKISLNMIFEDYIFQIQFHFDLHVFEFLNKIYR